ncbi:MAG: imidazole glycerol phosphate synthase subunit HisH [Anaerolineales bacterium]|nr:imidazole glycerol phosphate synthase subunit HisH [Anaerolineales bacterium]MCS7248479.1 imidazole glycerol phosphate synthase subunit HisH [Anaerolineales bacterium]MDW8162292.1 imidazole glycerol phosphate synthase subunit HisH [Anaerolineales bacterium]MDW8446561.1 imidazole glycerol phosphate synthase subunit HisH [Anaerolineales bacterium]
MNAFRRLLLLDVGTGNLRSVQKALEAVGAEVWRSNSWRDLSEYPKIVLPGVGAFGDFMHRLRSLGLEQPLRQALERGAALLGICVGMQALFESSEEMGFHIGLGLLKGKVVRFPQSPWLKVPHTGWNELIVRREHFLLAGLPEQPFAYFNHSYYCIPEEERKCVAATDHEVTFASVVAQGNLCGVQFHPEKSQKVGLKILQNFVECRL